MIKRVSSWALYYSAVCLSVFPSRPNYRSSIIFKDRVSLSRSHFFFSESNQKLGLATKSDRVKADWTDEMRFALLSFPWFHNREDDDECNYQEQYDGNHHALS